MTKENRSFRLKNSEELTRQLNTAEQQLEESLESDAERAEVLGLPVDQLKQRYPQQYQKYLKQLRIGKRQIEVGTEAVLQIYNEEEVRAVQDAMAGKIPLSEELYNKLNQDENVRRYSMAIFFPMIRERIIQGEKPEVYVLPTGGRQRALKVAFADRAFAVKTLENSKEKDIAAIAAELNLGPKQFDSISEHLTEEFIEGNLIATLDAVSCTAEFMQNLGRQIGQGIIKLHERNIVINDQLLRDDLGKSHTMVTPSGDVRFLDFGAAVDLSNFPDLTEEQNWLLMRSDAWASMSLYGLEGDELSAAVKSYGQRLVEQFPTKEELMKARDYSLINEGLGFISERLPNTQFLAKGINEALKK